MGKKRETLTSNQLQILYEEVDGLCPLCSKSLKYIKNGKNFNNYQAAHIYPLNPTPQDLKELIGVEKMSSNVNDIDNFILLCRDCHAQFDNPKDKNEYNKLLEMKRKFINKRKAKQLYKDYQIEDSIKEIIKKIDFFEIVNYKEIDSNIEINYSVKRIEDKLKGEKFSFKRKIKNNVSDYFLFIKKNFAELDEKETDSFDLIASQIKCFYRKLKKENKVKEEIYEYLCEWLYRKTDYISKEACQIIISYFIQNCEVFE